MQNYEGGGESMQSKETRHLDILPYQILRAVRFSILVAFFLFIVPGVMFLFRKALNKKIS